MRGHCARSASSTMETALGLVGHERDYGQNVHGIGTSLVYSTPGALAITTALSMAVHRWDIGWRYPSVERPAVHGPA